MEIKTCEQYVLAKLEEAENKIKDQEAIIESLIKELDDVKRSERFLLEDNDYLKADVEDLKARLNRVEEPEEELSKILLK